nr:MAG TPA: hypothetical protein [Caudoviricetes sp.]
MFTLSSSKSITHSFLMFFSAYHLCHQKINQHKNQR